MSLTKQFLKTKPVCKVRFRLSSEEAEQAEIVYLSGDFNDWDTGQPMRRLKDGSFSLQLDLDSGREYQFRYLLQDGRWINDPEADRYEFCTFAGGDNSVAVL